MVPSLRYSAVLFSALWLLSTAAQSAAAASPESLFEGDSVNIDFHAADAAENSGGTADLNTRCKFKLGKYEYDLCPILRGEDGDGAHVRTIEMKKDTPPTVTSTSYTISLRGPLQVDKSQSEEEGCPDGTWICMTMKNTRPTRPDEPPRVLQVVPVVGDLTPEGSLAQEHRKGINGSVRLAPNFKGEANDPSRLLVLLHGGMWGNQNQSAMFFLKCDKSVNEPTHPEFGWIYNNFHVFTWDTLHACTSTLTAPKPDNEPEPDPTPETPPDDIPSDHGGGGKNDGEEGDNFTVPPTDVRGPRLKVVALWMMGTIVITGVGAYFLQSSSPRLRESLNTHFPTLAAKIPSPHSLPLPSVNLPFALPFTSRARRKGYTQFRPDEQRLLSWAQEEEADVDLGLEWGLGGNGNGGRHAYPPLQPGTGEEDFMVNSGASSSAADGLLSGRTGVRGKGVWIGRGKVVQDDGVPLAPSPRRYAGVRRYGSAG